MKLRHYYHLYADGNFRSIVREHFSALRTSGLLDQLDRLHVGFVGSKANVEDAERLVAQILRHRAFTTNVAPSGWEQETQDVLFRDAAASPKPFLALYAHTKGAWSQNDINEHWRAIMTLHTVRNWRPATGAITDDIGAAGCFWAPFRNGRDIGSADGTRYFAGNFWWARSDAIAKIGLPERANRFDAERWIGKITSLGEPFGVANLFDAPLTVQSLARFSGVMSAKPLPFQKP